MAEPSLIIGECKPVIADYLACLKKVRGTNDPACRQLAKAYLKCRMDQYDFDSFIHDLISLCDARNTRLTVST